MKESASYCVGADLKGGRAPVRWATNAREPGAGVERVGGHVHAGSGAGGARKAENPVQERRGEAGTCTQARGGGWGGARKAGQARALLLPQLACLLILICIHSRPGSHLMAARFWLLPQAP